MLHARDDWAFSIACAFGHLEIAKWLWAICPDQEQLTMLHAKDDLAFRVACENGHQKVAEWLWGECKTPEEQKAMLHVKDRGAFRAACGNGHLNMAKWLWSICPEEEQSAMLHAKGDNTFGLACQKGHIEIAKWLWKVCPEQEQSAMLHARNDGAFLVAYQNGHLELAKWLWKVCPEQEQSAMLHARNDGAFLVVCHNGHQKVTEWLFDLYDTDVRLRLYKKHDNNGLLWSKLNEYEQIAMFNDQEWLISMVKKSKSTQDVQALISDDQNHEGKQALKTSLYMLNFIKIINSLNEMVPSYEVYHDYLKSCKTFNKNYFINHQLDEVVKIAIKAKNSDLLTNVLNGLEPTDLLREHKLEHWLSLAKQEGNTVFQDVYMSAVWRKELYQVLEKDNNATHYESLIAVVRVLLKHGIRLSALIERVMQDEQAGDEQWWFSIYQGVIINMLAEDTKSIKEYKCLIESFCKHPLVRCDHEVGSNEDTEYQERCLKIITWFESEFEKGTDNRSKWTKDELWMMFQQLSLGSGIIMGDDHFKCIIKLTRFKQQLETDVKRIQGALDVCSVMDGVDFDIHSGYAPNSDSTSCDPGKDKRKTLLGPADNQDQAAKEQRREDPAAGQSKFFHPVPHKRNIGSNSEDPAASSVSFYSGRHKRTMDVGSAEKPDQKRRRIDAEPSMH